MLNVVPALNLHNSLGGRNYPHFKEEEVISERPPS